MATLTNYHKVAGLKHEFILLQFWRSEVQNVSHRFNNVSFKTGSFKRLQERSCFLSFLTFRGCWHSLAYSHITPVSASMVTFPPPQTHSESFLREPLWLHWAYQNYLPSQDLNLILSTKSLLPSNVTFHRFWELGDRYSWEEGTTVQPTTECTKN